MVKCPDEKQRVSRMKCRENRMLFNNLILKIASLSETVQNSVPASV